MRRLLLPAILLAAVAHTALAESWRDVMPAADRARDELLSARVEAAYDTARGGYVFRGGEMSENAVLLAIANSRLGMGGQWMDHARVTLDWMQAMADSFGGGYYDRPADIAGGAGMIDKSTAVHARRLELLLAAWRADGNPEYRAAAARVVEFARRQLIDPRGGFVVAQVGDREPLPEPNGLMIHAWLSYAVATRDARMRDFAFASIDRTWQSNWLDDLGLLRIGVFGETRPRARLVDQAEMGRALVLAARVGGRAEDRARAIRLGDLLLERFQDATRGGFRSQVIVARDGSVKKASCEIGDNARAVDFLYQLARLTGDAKYHAAADRAVALFADRFDRLGLEAADWAVATRAAWADDLPPRPTWRPIASETPRRPVASKTYRTGGR